MAAEVAGADRPDVGGEGDDVRTPYREALRTHRLATAVATAAADGGRVEL